MTDQPSRHQITRVIERACQAPSLHNSQPWRWVVDLPLSGTADRTRIELFHDPDRMLPFTDAIGREMVMSCGAVLNHAQLAFAASGWQTVVDRMPDPRHPDKLATLEVSGHAEPQAHELALADAMDSRKSDRLPFEAPPDPATLAAEFRSAVAPLKVTFDLIGPEHREVLEQASKRAAAHRNYDQQYQDELRWWTGHSAMQEGVPREALLSGSEHRRVALGRKFPGTQQGSRRDGVVEDHSMVVMLSTDRDSLPEWLRCGEALSAVLLSATANGFASCALTHLTEIPSIRAMLAELGSASHPQVLIRVGATDEPPGPRVTQRRAVTEVLQFRG